MEKIYVLAIRSIYDGESTELGYFNDLNAMKPYIIKAAEELWNEPAEEENFEAHCDLDWLPKMKEEKCCHNCSECSYFYNEERHLMQLKRDKENLIHPLDNVYVYEVELNCEACGNAEHYQLRPLKKDVKLVSELYGEEVYSFTLPEHLRDV